MSGLREPVARLRTLRSVALRTPEAAKAADFYQGVWGLEEVDHDSGVSWLRGTGEEHHILEVRTAERNALGKIAFSVSSRREVDEAARRLLTAGVDLVAEPGRLDQAGTGYGLRFADPENRPLRSGLKMTGRRRDGSTFPAEVALSALPTENGMAVAAAIRDVSERLALEKERERLRARAPAT